MVMNLHQEIRTIIRSDSHHQNISEERGGEIMRERKRRREREREKEKFASSINHTLDSPHLNKYNDE